MIQEQLVADGSKDFIDFNKVLTENPNDICAIEGLRNSPLNEQSLKDLQRIRQILVENRVGIGDTQFLVTLEGRVVVSDPQRPSSQGFNVSIERIDEFMEAVDRAIQLKR